MDPSDPTHATQPAAARHDIPRLTLVLGASGYVGSHLVPHLLAHGHRVRAAARRLDTLQARAWHGAELVAADALEPASLDAALQGVELAYYLVHSMAAGPQFPTLDRQAAEHFRDAAARAGVRRIVYLGGLLPSGGASAHLASRGETGEILRGGPVPVTELRAGVIIGPGSAAFEVIRDLVFHLPVMVTPRWVSSRSQPVGLADVLEDLRELAALPEAAGAVFDVGGPEVLTYRDLMLQFGELVGRRPLVVPVPVLTPRLSSYWLDLVTAVPTNVARALIEGLEHDVLADDAALRRLLPRRLQTYREAARAAFEAEKASPAASAGTGVAQADAPPAPAEPAAAASPAMATPQGAPAPAATAPQAPAGQRWTAGSMLYRQNRADFAFYAKHMHAEAVAQAPVQALWHEVVSIGGENGYYMLDGLWRLRGCLDRLAGGTGLTRGRRHPHDLAVGECIDFWRVALLEPGHRLTLIAEMRMPGSAALGFEVAALDDRRSRIALTAWFHPAGVRGLAYWHSLAPAHAVLFPGLARAIARRAELRSTPVRA